MKNNSYNLNKDVLTIKTAFGHYSFKIEDRDLLDDTERIVRLMISEMDNVDTKLHSRKENSGQYARLLLTNLNLCEKYVRLEDRYRSLAEKLENINRKLESATILSTVEEAREGEEVAQTTSQSLDIPELTYILEPSASDCLKENLISIADENESDEMKPAEQPVETPSIISDSPPIDHPSPLVVQTVTVESEPILAEQSESFLTPIALLSESAELPVETLQELNQERDLCNSDEAAPLKHTAKRSGIASWKLKHSYLALKRKAMERVMQSKLYKANSENLVEEQFAPPLSLPEIQVEMTTPISSELQTSTQLEAQMTVKQAAPTYIITTPANSHHHINKPNIIKPKLYRRGEFELPSLSFLKNTSKKTEVDHHSIRRDAELLEKKLGYFGIKGEVMGVSPGPVITTFEYRPEPGIKISKIVNLADDLALALSAFSIRIVAPIPGKDVMGIEIPNIKKSLVPFIDIVSSDDFINSRSKVPICLGKDIVGNPVVVELDKMPHLLIAGATGTGKSVGLNAMITSILYKSTPEEVRFLMVDPKRIELSFYNDIPHLLTPVITDMKKATIALQWMVREMDRRYTLLAKSQVRHIEQYNQKIKSQKITSMKNESGNISDLSLSGDITRLAGGDNTGDFEEPEQLPYIVVIIDELADLMMTASRDIEFSLTRLAQMARAAGIHLILATQRPSVDVLTGIIKANFPTRISFQVSSKTDSRTIIDANGAETLLGNGDMLFVPPGTARLTRVHGTYLSENELMEITSFLKAQGKPEYVLDVITETDEEPPQESMDDDYDDKYNEALDFVVATKQASISGIQRALRVGYNRAARIIDIMEKRGIVGPSDGVKPRRVIVENIEY